MHTYLSLQQKRIQRRLHSFLRSCERSLPTVQGTNVPRLLQAFCKRGKTLRGSLVLLGHDLAGKRPGVDAVTVAAAAELFHAALLIHDDIMDRDDRRRGQAAAHARFASQGRAGGVADPQHFGISMAISTADAALFLGYELLATVGADKNTNAAMVGWTSRELVRVAIAQMQDVVSGTQQSVPSERAILEVYRQKTARYTFALPLSLGARLAGAPPGFLKHLDRLGETLGLMFQIRDDTIGLFGSSRQTGKPVGSDIREFKKTLYVAKLFKKLRGAERKRIQRIFGNPRLTAVMVRTVQQSIRRHGIDTEIARTMQQLAGSVQKQLASLRTPTKPKAVIADLVRYSQERVH